MTLFTKTVAVSADDGKIIVGESGYSSVTGIHEIGGSGGSLYSSWYRFTNVTIPQGSAISNARMKLRATGTQFGTTKIKNRLYCEDVNSALAPTSYANFNAKVKTSAFTQWDNPEVWTSGNDYYTPYFTSAVQEVINRVGWVSGNAIQIFILDSGNESPHRREAASKDAGVPPQLIINYVYTPPPVLSRPTIFIIS